MHLNNMYKYSLVQFYIELHPYHCSLQLVSSSCTNVYTCNIVSVYHIIDGIFYISRYIYIVQYVIRNTSYNILHIYIYIYNVSVYRCIKKTSPFYIIIFPRIIYLATIKAREIATNFLTRIQCQLNYLLLAPPSILGYYITNYVVTILRQNNNFTIIQHFNRQCLDD